MARLDEGAMIEWQGGPCPVSRTAWVDVRLRGKQYLRMLVAGYVEWHHRGVSTDVVAYRDLGAIVDSPAPVPEHEPTLEQRFQTFAREFRTSMQAVQEQIVSIDKGIRVLKTIACAKAIGGRTSGILPRPLDLGESLTFESEEMTALRELKAFSVVGLGDVYPVRSKMNPEKESAPEIEPESKAETQSDLRPELGSHWRHKSGRIYRVLLIANDTLDPKPKYPVTVVYGGGNGKMWAGALDDWHRRMTLVPENESAPEMEACCAAETQSGLASEVDPDGKFERAYNEAFGIRLDRSV